MTEEALAAARWLASIRRPDGSLGVTINLPEPGWPTPFALLLWAAVGGFKAERSAALGWLLRLEGQTYRQLKDDPMGHDASIVGWPWVAGTHSWVEPSALALLALGREGRADHPRAVEGARLLVDRAIPGGGWNLGNPVVFGTPLRPLPGPSGMALLALAMVGSGSGYPSPQLSPTRGEGAGKDGDADFSSSPLPLGEGPGVRGAASPTAREKGSNGGHSSGLDPHPGPLPKGEGGREGSRRAEWSQVIAPAIAYLRKALAETLAPISLGWGLLGLRAWGAEPAESPGWLDSAFERAASREPRPAELALLLLAAGPRSLEVLGITDREEVAQHA